jgi:hypothetical protein
MGSEDGSEVVIRVVNYGSATSVTIALEAAIAPNTVSVGVLQGETGDDLEQNSPGQPTRIAPQYSSQAYSPDAQFFLAANSFTIFTFNNVILA